MAKRKIRRRTGEGVSISGPATVRVLRGVTLIIEAAREAQVQRIPRRELDRETRQRHARRRGAAPACDGE